MVSNNQQFPVFLSESDLCLMIRLLLDAEKELLKYHPTTAQKCLALADKLIAAGLKSGEAADHPTSGL